MTDQLDPKLLALFAESRPELPADDFNAKVLEQLQRALRRRRFGYVAIGIAMLIAAAVVTPFFVSATMGIANWVDARNESAVSGIAWMCSLMIGGFVLWRQRIFRR
jgi:hypothetical protein